MIKSYAAWRSYWLAKREDQGATAVEYGLLVALIAAVIIAAVVLLGGEIDNAFDTVSNEIDDPPAAPAPSASATG